MAGITAAAAILQDSPDTQQTINRVNDKAAETLRQLDRASWTANVSRIPSRMGGQVQLLGQLQFAGAQPYLLTERKLHAPGFRVWFVQLQQPLGLTATADCCC